VGVGGSDSFCETQDRVLDGDVIGDESRAGCLTALALLGTIVRFLVGVVVWMGVSRVGMEGGVIGDRLWGLSGLAWLCMVRVRVSSRTLTRLLMVLRTFSTLSVAGREDPSFKVNPSDSREQREFIEESWAKPWQYS
jgi:hypothetical protein